MVLSGKMLNMLKNSTGELIIANKGFRNLASFMIRKFGFFCVNCFSFSQTYSNIFAFNNSFSSVPSRRKSPAANDRHRSCIENVITENGFEGSIFPTIWKYREMVKENKKILPGRNYRKNGRDFSFITRFLFCENFIFADTMSLTQLLRVKNHMIKSAHIVSTFGRRRRAKMQISRL